MLVRDAATTAKANQINKLLASIKKTKCNKSQTKPKLNRKNVENEKELFFEKIYFLMGVIYIHACMHPEQYKNIDPEVHPFFSQLFISLILARKRNCFIITERHRKCSDQNRQSWFFSLLLRLAFKSSCPISQRNRWR